MKLLFVLFLIAVLATSVLASQVTFDKSFAYDSNPDNAYLNLYLISLPGIPAGTATRSPGDPVTMLKDSDPNDVTLLRIDPTLGNSVPYQGDGDTDFGSMLLTDGYYLTTLAQPLPGIANQQKIHYTGYNDVDNMDVWVSLPGYSDVSNPPPYWTLIGNPYSHGILWDNIKVTDGNTTKTMEQAIAAGWVADSGIGLDPYGNSLQVGMSTTYDVSTWDPWVGLWMQSTVRNLAFILPAGG